ncbi:histidine kinase HHK3 [Xylariales sp. PMI_506]|nr:histidine kinase HHK3 [Xylariales sp. PMI_506]
MTSCDGGKRTRFVPKADATVLSSSKPATPPARPRAVEPIYDPLNLDRPIDSWPTDTEDAFYPPKSDPYAPSSIPNAPECQSDRYLRGFLAKDERLRLSMLWYYTRGILEETDFLLGLQEKAYLAKESTGWEFVVIGILDISLYIRLAAIGLPVTLLPRGETICAHTVVQPPGNIFLLPNMLEDWRFQDSPYVESGGLKAYAGAPLRLQNEHGECVGLGSLCVASSTSQDPLTKLQQQTLARLADWVVSDIVQCARVRRQRERRQMSDLINMAQRAMVHDLSEEPVLRILRDIYPNATISLQSSQVDHIELGGRAPLSLSDIEDGSWEDIDYIDEFIATSNHQEPPTSRVVRVLTAPFEGRSGSSLLVVASSDFRLVFDDVDSWFIQTCASMMSQMWQKSLLAEVMKAKEKFLRGICHQLRTPIHGILGSVDLLAEELRYMSLREGPYSIPTLVDAVPSLKSSEPHIYLDTIKTAGRDLISIVNSMITLNRWADIAIAERHYAIHSVYELEKDIASEIGKVFSGDARYRASVFFNHRLPLDCDSMRIDMNVLRDSLLPLVINAIQNTPDGFVTITMTIDPDKKNLVVDVEDTGRGIHPDNFERIFDAYEKDSMHSTGAGLGLTLASKFATLLHGSINLKSSVVDHGSHFRATFREVEFVNSPTPVQPLAARLEKLPSRFYRMPSYSGGISAALCDNFAKFLAHNGFTCSDDTGDGFIILDHILDLEERRAYLAAVPSDRVAICLVPSSDGDASPDILPNNVIQIGGPFLSSKMSWALEKADAIISGLALPEAPQTPLSQAEGAEPLYNNSQHDKGTVTNGLVELLANLPDLNGDTIQSIPDNTIATCTDGSLHLVIENQDDSQSAEHAKGASPIFPALVNSPKPMALLVDDNAINLRIMEIYCAKRNLPYCCATDGQQAIDMYTRQQSLAATGDGSPIQLILMDLQMPVCDGITATKQIRLLEKQNNWQESIVFIVTGQDSPTDKTDAEEAGADEYFVKPVGIKVLDRSVKQYFPAFESS